MIKVPENLEKERRKQGHKEKAKQFAEEGKEIAYRFLEDQIQIGLEYLKEEENREKLKKSSRKGKPSKE